MITENINFINDLLAAGAKKIWSNTNQVTLIGGPKPDCDYYCKKHEDCPFNLKCCNNLCKNPWECIFAETPIPNDDDKIVM